MSQNLIWNIMSFHFLQFYISLNGILQPNKEVISQPDYLQPTPQTENNTKISISQEDYHMLLELANTSTQLYNKSQELVKRLTKGRIS